MNTRLKEALRRWLIRCAIRLVDALENALHDAQVALREKLSSPRAAVEKGSPAEKCPPSARAKTAPANRTAGEFCTAAPRPRRNRRHWTAAEWDAHVRELNQ